MDIEIFTIADFAQSVANKMNIIGTFNTLYFEAFPFTYGQWSIALRIRLDDSEAGKHPFSIYIVDPKGQRIGELKGDIETKKVQGFDSSVTTLALGVPNIKFEGPGKYPIEFHLDGKLQKKLTLNVVKKSSKN